MHVTEQMPSFSNKQLKNKRSKKVADVFNSLFLSIDEN
jgi:hypothetical protein